MRVMEPENNGSKGMVRIFRTRAERELLVEKYQVAGITAREFARQEGISYQTFCSWLKNLRREEKRVEFKEVKAEGLLSGGEILEIEIGKARVRIYRECGVEFIKGLLAGLRS